MSGTNGKALDEPVIQQRIIARGHKPPDWMVVKDDRPVMQCRKCSTMHSFEHWLLHSTNITNKYSMKSKLLADPYPSEEEKEILGSTFFCPSCDTVNTFYPEQA